MQSLRRCGRVRCAPIKKSLSKQALKGTRTRLWSNKTKIAKLSELRKNEPLPRGADACRARCGRRLCWRRWRVTCKVRGGFFVGVAAENVIAACGVVFPFPLTFPRAKSNARRITFRLVAFPMRCMRRKHVAMSRNLFLPRLVTKQYVSLSSACNGAFRLKLTYIHAGRGDFIHACVHKNCSLVTFKVFIVGFQLTPTLCEMKNFVLPSHRIS